jgi:regulator of ribonuclease activity A
VTATADLLDKHPDAAVCALALSQFGGIAAFDGPVATVRCLEDNVPLNET